MSLASYLAARTAAVQAVSAGPADTPDTPAQNLVYQAKAAQTLGCTPDTPDTPPGNTKQTEADVCARTCRACTHRLPAGTCSQPVAAGLREHYSIVWPEPTHAATCPAYTTKPQATPAGEPKMWEHQAAADAALATMAQRQACFERLGFDRLEAGHLADRLLIRDRDLDDRHLCLECLHQRGRMGAWHCMSSAGLPGQLGTELVTMLQKCGGFA